MRITKLVLSGYKRLMLNNINELTYIPESDFQLILGTNGSGKSSVLYELSPLPAHNSNYMKNGFKHIYITHKHSQYELISNFKSVNKHNFIKDGVELNPGGTGAVQNELVWQEFNINKEIHELLIGEVEFTNLSPAKRREWITKLSDIDFTYALGVYKSLKSAARDAQGALKHTKVRLVTEKNKLLTIEDLEVLDNEYKTLTDKINNLFQKKSNNNYNLPSIKQEISQKNNTIEKLSTTLVQNFPDNKNIKPFDYFDELVEYSKSIQNRINENINLKNSKSKTLLDLQELTQTGHEGPLESRESLNEKLTKFKDSLDLLFPQIKKWKEFIGNGVEAKNAIYSIKDTLASILQTLPINDNNKFNRSSYNQAKEKAVSLKEKIEVGRSKINNLHARLGHLKSLKEQECPKCNHKWTPGKSEQEVTKLEDTIEDFNKKLSLVISESEKQQEYIELYENYEYQVRQFRNLVNQTIVLKPFWDEMIEKSYLFESPKIIIVKMEKLILVLDKVIEYDRINENYSKLSSLLEDGQLEQKVKLLNSVDKLDKEIQDSIQVIKSLDKELKEYSKYSAHLEKYLNQGQQLDELVKSLHELKLDAVMALEEEYIDSLISELQTHLAFVQTKRGEKQTLDGIIKDLELDVEQLDLNFKSLKLLTDELSPVDGLIAEQLKGFITTYTTHVNEVIEKIWNYELKVLPCSTANGDLDYKFPLSVRHEGKENITPDISKGSEAQVEMINFSFKLVTMVYLGLDEYPVYLDEFSRSFDEQHRLNAMYFIKQLINTTNYTQLFLISHYASQFGGFTNSEIMVLDPTNITVPTSYNNNVKFN